MSEPALGRARALGVAVLVAIFVSGALAGAAVEHLRRRESRPIAPAEPALTPQVIENMKMGFGGVPVMYEALGLTEEQRQRIRQIIDASRPKTDSLLRDTWPALRAIIDSVRGQVDQVLTTEQRARLAAMRRGQ